MTRKSGNKVARQSSNTFTAQQNDNDILSALLRTSLLRSTCTVVHADVLRILSATQQANSLRTVVTLGPTQPRFLRFSLNLSGLPAADDRRRRRHPIRPAEGHTGQGRAALQLHTAITITLLLLLAALLNALARTLLRPALLA